MVIHDSFVEKLKHRLNSPLPGYGAQSRMEPPFRNTFSLDSRSAKQAATMLCLYKQVDWKFLLIKRSSHPKDKHKGQIGFPGGSLEINELSIQAAVRELEEEINIGINDQQVLGKLSDLFIPVSNFLVSPYISVIDIERHELIMQESEVVDILHVSLSEFMDDANVKRKEMKMVNGITIPNVPYYDLNNEVVWGATAMMLSEFREVMKEIM